MISIAGESLVYRCADFSSALSLLMPTFALLSAPAYLTVNLRRKENAPLPISPLGGYLSFGTILDARLLSMLCRSTSELLRTL
jgi:hypothetical protein